VTRTGIVGLLALVALSIPSGSASAQVVRERLVPLDTAGTVLEVGAELRRTLDLFPEVRDFQAARLFESSGGLHVLEISTRDSDGSLVRERRPLTAIEVRDLRVRVSIAMVRGGVVRFAQDGRAGLVVTSAVLGIGFYGWAVPAVLDLEDRPAVGAYLLAAGASFLLPYTLTTRRAVSRAQRNAAAWGATRGIVYGLALGDALTGGEEEDEGAGNDGDVTLATSVATSILGGVLGFAYGGRPGVDEGLVAYRAAMGDFSLLYGFGTAVALGLYDRDPICQGDICVSDSEPDRTPAGHLVALGVAAAGTWAAGRWPSARSYTLGDTRVLRSFGLLGAQAALPFHAAATDGGEHDRSLAATMVLGSAAGLLVGDRLLRDRQLSSGDGLLVLAGHVAGGLGALGIAYLFDSDGGGNEDVLYLGATAAGSLAGSWLTLRAVGDDGAEADLGASRARGVLVEPGPLSLALATMIGGTSGPRVRMPLLTVRF